MKEVKQPESAPSVDLSCAVRALPCQMHGRLCGCMRTKGLMCGVTPDLCGQSEDKEVRNFVGKEAILVASSWSERGQGCPQPLRSAVQMIWKEAISYLRMFSAAPAFHIP